MTSTTTLEPELMAPTPEKVHLRGLDNLTTKDITAFANEYSPHAFEKVEWIDDTSANIIYASAELALSALESFVDLALSPANPNPMDMLPAKSFPGFPNTRLMVRLAVVGDRKQPGARERSRFYLLNPEHDRREQAPREDRGGRGGRRSYRDRDSEYKRGYNERGSGRLQRDAPAFDESLYDDDEATLAKRASVERDSTPPSYAEKSRPRGRGGRRDRELFPEKEGRSSGRLRDRSASPVRGRDGDIAMDDLAADNRAKRNRSDAGKNRMSAQAIKTRLSNSNAPHLELFPERAAGNRRKSAFEDDEAADLFAEKMRLPSIDGGASAQNKGGLDSRISRPGQERDAFKIRGQAATQPKPELSIKGLASGGARSKELFPTKVAVNTGKELFSDRIGGGRRQKAEDLFR